MGKASHQTVRPGGQSMRGSQFIKQILRDNRGATAIEYGLILALICLFILATVQVMAGEIMETWTGVQTTTADAMN
jgi:pilus assembly protein Flp/PilA